MHLTHFHKNSSFQIAPKI